MSWTKTARRIVIDYSKGGGTTAEDVANWLSDACNIIDDLEAQKKAAAERVRWINAGSRYVALVGEVEFHLFVEAPTRMRIVGLRPKRRAKRTVDLGIVSSLEAASRRVRAYRAGKWSPK